MNNSIKVTIVVAIYKSEKFLEKLLDSILNQSYKNIEVILVDDGSPDKSGEICDKYAKMDDRIIVIHKENGGACEARNVGLEHATGKYVTIIDGDDWLELDYIEYLLNLAENTGSEMAMTDRIFTTRDRQQIDNDRKEIWTSEKAASAILYPIIPIGPWNKLYNLDILKKNNITFSVPWSGEGLYFSFMAAQYSNKVAVGHRKIYSYRLNNSDSGLTNYNIQMGINALWNIKNIKKNNINGSKMIQHAANWHIWKNYNFLLKLIIATNSVTENKALYDDCRRNIRFGLFKVLIYSKLGLKTKLKMLYQGMFPVHCAKNDIKKEQIALKNDVMK